MNIRTGYEVWVAINVSTVLAQLTPLNPLVLMGKFPFKKKGNGAKRKLPGSICKREK